MGTGVPAPLLAARPLEAAGVWLPAFAASAALSAPPAAGVAPVAVGYSKCMALLMRMPV